MNFKFMKHILLLVLFLHFLNLQAINSSSDYTLSGKIKGLTDQKVYIVYFSGNTRVKDSANVKDYKFNFKGKINEDIIATIIFKNPSKTFNFILAPGENILKGNVKDIDKSFVSGSLYQDGWIDLNKKLTPINEREKKFQEELQKNENNVSNQVEQTEIFEKIKKDRSTEIKNFIISKPGELAGLFSFYNYLLNSEADLVELSKLLDKFDSSLKSSIYYEKSKQFLEVGMRTTIGNQLLDFSQTDTNNVVVSSKDYLGKYLLIDFWASWCSPCRAENPNVVATFLKYKDKGFDVLGVSLDNNKENWMHAIHKDNLQWKQVSDLKQWKNEVAVLFGIKAIPTNILVDPTGKIIAKNLRGEALDKKLAEIFVTK